MTERNGSALAEAPVVGPAGPLPDGVIVQGEFAGFKHSREFTRRETGEKITAKPKIGIRLPSGEVLAVTVADDQVAATIGVQYGKSDRIAVAVRVRPPFGSSGPVKFVLAGGEDEDNGWD